MLISYKINPVCFISIYSKLSDLSSPNIHKGRLFNLKIPQKKITPYNEGRNFIINKTKNKQSRNNQKTNHKHIFLSIYLQSYF